MKKIDIFVLSLVGIIVLGFFLNRSLRKEFRQNKSKKIREDFNSLYNYSLFELGESHGIGMFAGGDEVFVYNIGEAPIAGAAGSGRGGTINMPTLGFKPEEVKKIPNFEKAVKTENDIEYVDNNLMVPLIYHVVKRLVLMFDSLQEQINDCCY